MDTKENQNDKENVDGATTDQPDTNNNNSTNSTSSNISSSGLQQIEDDDNSGLPLPMGMAEEISNRAEPPKKKIGKIEQLDDNLGPELPAAMLEASLNAADPEIVSKTITNNLSSINDLSPPTPFNSAEYEDTEDTIAKKKAKDEMTNQKPATISEDVVLLPPSDIDSIYEPSREIIEGGEDISYNTNRRGWDDIELRAARRDIESQQTRTNHEDTAGSIDNGSILDADADEIPMSTNQEGLPEIEAYLVEDVEEEVYIATPTLPWWKQRRTKILLGVVLVIVATLSIVLVVELSRPEPEPVTNTVVATNTTAPSLSLSPSSSMAPSSSPTQCVNKITSNKQEIELEKDLQVTDPLDPRVAVDGKNMVVVAKDGKYCNDRQWCELYNGPAFITFYTLDNNEEWQRVQTPIRVDDVTFRPISVSLAGSTAFVGFPDANDGAGDVLVYKQNQFDEWDRVDDPFTQTANTTSYGWFGWSVDIDGDLACVGGNNGMNLYRRDDDSKWIQFDTIKDSSINDIDCLISGDTIAVHTLTLDDMGNVLQLYKYNQEKNEVFPIQEPISTAYRYAWSMDLSNDYLVYWDWNTDEDEQSAFFIYYRNEMNETYTLHQQFNVTGTYLGTVALDDDILVEAIALDESYEDYKISGRTLLATMYNDTSLMSEVYSYNIQDCTQDMPTQSPTLSPTSPPTVSSLPTTTFRFTCFGADDGSSYGILYNAVRSYVDQDCANNQQCDIAQVYGWPLNSWCVENVAEMSWLFRGMDTFNEDINGWNTSSVTGMYGMFEGAQAFNQDLSNFNTSSVTDMTMMFNLATSFNGNLSTFDTSKVTSMQGMFYKASSFNQDVSNFDTSKVTNMNGMFLDATYFNIDLSHFDTSSVTDMSYMFARAVSFNRDLSKFNISSVTDMDGMFSEATSFNGDLCSWQDSFPYTAKTGGIFINSGCTYQDTPNETQKGPFVLLIVNNNKVISG